MGPVNVNTTLPTATVYRYNSSDVCREIFGYTSVYRICMGVASFFFLMMILMLCVFSSRDPRSFIQNGYVNDIVTI